MGWRTAKNAERKGIVRNFFANHWEIFATPEDVSATPWKKSSNRP